MAKLLEPTLKLLIALDRWSPGAKAALMLNLAIITMVLIAELLSISISGFKHGLMESICYGVGVFTLYWTFLSFIEQKTAQYLILGPLMIVTAYVLPVYFI